MSDSNNNGQRQSRRQDTFVQVVLVLLSVALMIASYLLVEDRERQREFQIAVLEKIDKLEDTVTELEVFTRLCECRIVND